jgi:hypothetical protein
MCECNSDFKCDECKENESTRDMFSAYKICGEDARFFKTKAIKSNIPVTEIDWNI